MKRFRVSRVAGFFASGLISFGCAKMARGESYSILDLGPLSSWTFGNAGSITGINDRGEIIGTIGFSYSMSGNDYYGFRTNSVRPINLATDNIGQSGFSTVPTGINNLGQVVGKAFKAGTYGDNWYSFRTASDSKINPATDSLYMPNYSITATGINDAGQVIGNAWNVQEYLAFLTAPNSQVNQANILSPNIESNAVGINNLGQVVGTFYTGTGSNRKDFAFRTGPNGEISGKLADNLGTSGGKSISPYVINDAGQVVGSSFNSDGYIHAFRTAPNVAINPATDDLGSLGLFSYARAINSRGVVVGDSQLNDGYAHAFIYKNSNSGMQDLNVLANASKQNWTLTNATGINSQGQIVGVGIHNNDGQTHGFVLTPTVSLQRTAETPSASLTHFVPPTSDQLKVYSNGQFISGGNIDPTKPTVVITHGFSSSTTGWVSNIASKIPGAGSLVNVVAWDWSSSSGNIFDPRTLSDAASRAPSQGTALGDNLLLALGLNYHQPIHFIGHSLGTIVNAEAVDTMHNHGYDSGNTKTQITMFDDAETANLFAGGTQSSTTWARSVPQTGHAYYIDNYISSFGQLHSDPNTTNVILTNVPPYPWPANWLSFHSYPQNWYKLSMDNPDKSDVGYKWSIENGTLNGQQPAGKYFIQSQNPLDSELKVNLIGTQAEAENIITERNKGVANQSTTFGFLPVDALRSSVRFVGNVSAEVELKLSELGNVFIPKFTLTEGSPADVWIPITIPKDAQVMSLDFLFKGMSAGDTFIVGVGETRLFAIEGAYISDSTTFNSGLLDVSQWSGQDVELFLGLLNDNIPGGSVSVSNISFESIPEPSMFLAIILTSFVLLKRRRFVV